MYSNVLMNPAAWDESRTWVTGLLRLFVPQFPHIFVRGDDGSAHFKGLQGERKGGHTCQGLNIVPGSVVNTQ